MPALSARIQPMKAAGTHHFIERTYRESSPFQWVRELLVNATEAGATRIEFGIEWQAVEDKGVYRRLIADNGKGMTSTELTTFFNTYGGGGKPIGGAHENFGVGSKTSLLPWNHYGMVVISWVDGEASMIWVARDPANGEYGLRYEECADQSGNTVIAAVYKPYLDPDHGCDWSLVKPDFIQDHGTVVVLMGNKPTDNTVEGDRSREEADIKGISSFLNRRMWDISGYAEVFVDELRTSDRSMWPRSEAVAHGPAPEDGQDQRTNNRRIEGARHFIYYESGRNPQGKLGARGTVPLKDGTEVDWFLWEGERPKVHSYAAMTGYIAALYNHELYDVAAHHSTYRLFGITENSVRQLVWLIIRPVAVDAEGKRGVYPRTDRSSLLLKGGPMAGGQLPYNEWAAEFSERMPAEILAALRAARHGSAGTIDDAEWRDRLAERFGARWKLAKLRMRQGGEALFHRASEGMRLLSRAQTRTTTDAPAPSPSATPERRPKILVAPKYAKLGGELSGDLVKTGGGLPRFRRVGQDDVSAGILAVWQPNDPECPEGVVLINVDHPVLRGVIEHWQAQYADHHADGIENDVIEVYGQVAVSKVAHSEHLKGILPTDIIEKHLRSEHSMTMSLLGLMAEDHLISTRVGGKYTRKRGAENGRKRTVRPR